jgi:hypothetical protein
MGELDKGETYFNLGIMISVVAVTGVFSYFMAVLALTILDVLHI